MERILLLQRCDRNRVPSTWDSIRHGLGSHTRNAVACTHKSSQALVVVDAWALAVVKHYTVSPPHCLYSHSRDTGSRVDFC